MSSLYVRDEVINFIQTQFPSEKLIDLTAQFEELPTVIQDAGIGANEPWLGIEFLGDDEQPITVPATNGQGTYRETGSIYIHVVGVAGLGQIRSLIQRGESIRDVLRGRRINQVVLDSVGPMNFDNGATLNLEGGYVSGSFLIGYDRDLNLA